MNQDVMRENGEEKVLAGQPLRDSACLFGDGTLLAASWTLERSRFPLRSIGASVPEAPSSSLAAIATAELEKPKEGQAKVC
jgi:hypothetical protein